MAGEDDAADVGVPVVPDKRDWPRTEYGTIDWEAAFEESEVGLISLVERSTTANGILACSKVIIHALFNRKDDAEARVDYERKLNEAMIVDAKSAEDDDGQDVIRRAGVIALLRDIKAERVERAEFHIARIKAGIDAPDERRQAGAEDPGDAVDFTAQEAFVEALSQLMAGRLEALRADVAPGRIGGAPPPYPVAPEFAERFDQLIREQFAPAMMGACRPFIMQAEHQEPAARVGYILENMEERRSREILWGSWQVVWRQLTEEQDLPEKPAEEKQGLLGRLTKKKAQPAWKGEQLTREEWEDAVRRIERDNARAKNIWARLTEAHARFQPPDDGDRRTLMNLFARTAGALTRQISAVRQIAEQSGNQGKIFTDYQQGKDIDLPLVCACCQKPDILLDKGVLKDFMRGFPDSMRHERFRMTSRFFRDYL